MTSIRAGLLNRALKSYDFSSGAEEWRAAGDDPAALAAAAELRRKLDQRTPPALLRRLWAPDTRTLDGSTIHVLTPRAGSTGRLLVYLHGGAYVIGPAAPEWISVASFARRQGYDVAVVLYPRAPEATADITLEATVEAWSSLVGEGPQHYDAGRTAIMGSSAGGGLALALAQTIRDRVLPPPAALILSSPWVDLAMSTDTLTDNVDSDLILPDIPLHRDAEVYAGELAATDTRVSPLYGSMYGLPPVHVQVGVGEMLRAEGEAVVERVQSVGGTAELHVDPAGQHCGFGAPTAEGKKLRVAAGEFLASTVGASRPPRLRELTPVGLEFLDEAPFRTTLDQAIAVPASTVFNCLADADGWSAFLPISVEWTTPEPRGIGTTRTVTGNGQRIDETFLAWDEGRHMAFRFDRSTLPVQAFLERWEVTPTGDDACELSWTYAFEWGGPIGAVAATAFDKAFAANGRRSLRKLARVLEADPTRWA